MEPSPRTGGRDEELYTLLHHECMGGAPPSRDESSLKSLKFHMLRWGASHYSVRQEGSQHRSKAQAAAICFGDQTPALGDEDEGAQSVFFSPHGDCQGEKKILSILPNIASPPTPTHLPGFPVTWLSTVTNWYRVNNLCGKDPKPPRAACMAGAGLVYLLRCVWLLRITEYN